MGQPMGSWPGGRAGVGSTNQQWTVVPDGANVQIQNVATGMYLDGMGRTTSGSTVGQYSGSGGTNQQWKVVSVS